MSTNQPSESFPTRTFYQPRGVDWGRFLPWTLLVFGVAAALAAGMFFLFKIGHYYIIIVPALAGLAVAGMVNAAVSLGHCRNRWIAALLGFSAGLVLYLGSFYFGMLYYLGKESAGRPDILIAYIRIRMATDVTRDTYAPRSDDDSPRQRRGNAAVNWGRFALELGFVLFVTTGAGVRRAKRAYCPDCGRWMTRETSAFNSSQSEELLQALRSGSARSLAAVCATAPCSSVPNTTLAVEICPSLKEGRRDCLVYATVKNITANAQGATLDAFEQAKGKIQFRGMQLNPDELAALALRFPFFETHAGHSAVAALRPTTEAETRDSAGAAAVARMDPVSPDEAGKIMTRKAILIGNAFSLGGLLVFFAGMGLLAFGGMKAFPDHPPIGGVSPATKTLGITVMIAGGAMALAIVVIMCIDSSFLGNRFLRNRLRQFMERRTSPMVDPRDPEALLVEIVPRVNWGKMMLEDASDVGLLLVDESRREVRFEGDKERWRIPAAAITHCEVERFAVGHAQRYFVVLQGRHADGFWEAPLRERGGSLLLGWKQKNKARKLCERIQAMSGVGIAGVIAGTGPQ